MPYRNQFELELRPPPVGSDNLKSQIEDIGAELAVVDFIYEKIRGRSVIDELIAPLTGDFNRIRANGEAWTTVGQALRTVSDNQVSAVKKLRHQHWTEGAAASAFESHIRRPWKFGLQGAALGCDWIKKGFDVLADQAVRVGEVAVGLLESLLKILKKIALKSTGIGTIIGGAIDVINGDIPFKKDLETAKKLIQSLLRLKDALERLLASAKRFFAGVEMITDVLTSIPSADNTHGAIAAARSFREGEKGVREARHEADQARKDARKHLDDIKNTKIG